ncbi:hypothetical protein BLA29_001431 [Euroglyphus maynei]|uniref:Uncharacterized protein n=1 Tax=Euroglyphus maynei TaxID=6958 RepID=A0A1Y3AUW1_EURMA|nr:hypothetical protein BLA29_001431 [Euroglyphus maynei]
MSIKFAVTIVVTCYLHLAINEFPSIQASNILIYPNPWHLDYYDPYWARESVNTESELNDNELDGVGGRNKRGYETFSTDGGGKSVSNIRKPLLFKRATTNVRKPLLFKRFIQTDSIRQRPSDDEEFLQHLFSPLNNHY